MMDRHGAWNLGKWTGRIAERAAYGLPGEGVQRAYKDVGDAIDAADEASKLVEELRDTCYSTTDCPSGYACNAGKCIKSSPFGGSGSPGGGGECDPVDPPVTPKCGGGGCTSPGCGDEGGRDCCGGPIYTCFGGAPQCEPCEDLPGCRSFCDTHYSVTGDLASGCTADDVCQCGSCSNGECLQLVSSSNCNCDPPGSAGECETCNEQTGDYEEDCTKCDQLYQIANFQCPYPNQDQTVSGQYRQSSCEQAGIQESGYTILRRQLLAKCNQLPNKPQESCKAQGECEANCVCVTNSWSSHTDSLPQPGISSLHTCPPGKQCTTVGSAYIVGAFTQITVRVCDRLPDCGCQNPTTPCGECEVCVNDECVRDQANCQDCENQVCSGQCCGTPGACVPGIKYRALDNCHGATQEFCVAVGTSVTLGPPVAILASGAVCGRYHTHCAILINGQDSGRLTLDCQTGLQSLGSCEGNVCPG